ncbi:cytochrome c [Pedobacter sp. P351]|uniref:c-type cytochrome n=1 Tax=Pedobacter superstes TaxID=3133441 RepID=UPI0030AF0488
MKKFGKIIVYIVLSLAIIVGALLSYVKFALPNVGEAPDLKVELSPQRIERGKYLAMHVTICIDCHSTRDWSKFSGPLDPDKIGVGGEKFDEAAGLPGTIYSANLTPHNLKSWTDGEIFRAITTGVKKDGSAIFPIMPYDSYGKMDKEDIYSIIAFLRTLPEKNTSIPERDLDFPLNFIVNTIPQKANFQTLPPPSKELEYGAYLVNAAACIHCHTNFIDGKSVEGMEFAGGREFMLPGGSVFTANITPDKETGIGNWTKQQFVEKFKLFADSGHIMRTVSATDFQTVMPWTMYGGMKSQDIEAIYSYLRTVKPIKNRVTKFVPAKG